MNLRKLKKTYPPKKQTNNQSKNMGNLEKIGVMEKIIKQEKPATEVEKLR